MKKYIYLIALFFLVFTSCEDNNSEPSTTNKGVAVTGNVTEIWALSATIEGRANLDAINSSYSTVDYGIEYSTETSFKDIIRVSAKEQQNGNLFNVQLSKLNPDTKYYYRAYVRTNNSQNYQGDIKSFTTNSVTETGDATEVGSMTAVINGTVNLDEKISATIYMEYSTQSSLQQVSQVNVNKPTGRTFSVELSALRPETKYYYRTSVIFWLDNKKKTYFGEVKTFTTNKMSETDMYVDLGLTSGTLWATVNVGANSPEDVGDKFAWGETTPKNYYDWTTYKWCNGTYNTITKYCTNSYSGTVDNKTELDSSDDAATANWGAEWQMPSSEQIDELMNECTYEQSSINKVTGCLVISKRNGKSIFLPYTEHGNYSSDDKGRYWSRTLGSTSVNACMLYFENRYSSPSLSRKYANRSDGFCVRAVRVSQN